MNFTGLLLTVCALYLYSCAAVKIKAPENLIVSEGFKNPIGFYNPKPTFSWELPVSKTIKYQFDYQIVVASSKDLLPYNPNSWNSKKKTTSQSAWVNYEGDNLKSCQKVYCQVKYWDQDDEVSAWSDVTTFELGFVNNRDWKAKWIGLPAKEEGL